MALGPLAARLRTAHSGLARPLQTPRRAQSVRKKRGGDCPFFSERSHELQPNAKWVSYEPARCQPSVAPRPDRALDRYSATTATCQRWRDDSRVDRKHAPRPGVLSSPLRDAPAAGWYSASGLDQFRRGASRERKRPEFSSQELQSKTPVAYAPGSPRTLRARLNSP